VDRVLAVIGSEPRTVEQICESTGLEEHKVRAVLYSRFVVKRLKKSKVGKVTAFKLKADPKPHETKAAGKDKDSVSARVLEMVKGSADGITAGKIAEALRDSINSPNTVGTALYNYKKRGIVTHDATTGIYKIKT
jgi:hypothetical protein